MMFVILVSIGTQYFLAVVGLENFLICRAICFIISMSKHNPIRTVLYPDVTKCNAFGFF